MILADANYVILTLLRSHRDDDKGLAIMARHAYPVHAIRLRTALEPAQLDAVLEMADDKQSLRGTLPTVNPLHSMTNLAVEHWGAVSRFTAAAFEQGSNRRQKRRQSCSSIKLFVKEHDDNVLQLTKGLSMPRQVH